MAVRYLHTSEAEAGTGEWAEVTAVFSWLGTPTPGTPQWLPPDRYDNRRASGRHRAYARSEPAVESRPAPAALARPTAGRRLARLLVWRAVRPRSEFPMVPAAGRQVRW